MKIIARKMMLLAVGLGLCVGGVMNINCAYADDEPTGDGTYMSMSPMNESVILNPGDVYKSSFMLSNPGYSHTPLSYAVSIMPFYVDENYDPIFVNEGDSGTMYEWIEITFGEKGVIEPNENKIVEFEITVPKDAPAGGQYACIRAYTDVAPSEIGTVNIAEALAINHIVLAEITGNTTYSGEIVEAGVQSFLLGGNITASSTVINTGNVHAQAEYTMKVYPLFSDTPIYTNEEDENKAYILPNRTYYDETVWAETPMMGIFNVEYVVEFQGLTTTVRRMVIVCPWWLLFIIIAIIMILVIRIMTLIKLQKVEDRSKAQMS